MPSSNNSSLSSSSASGSNGIVTNGTQNGHHSSIPRAKDVGIIAMELYFPRTYVEQSELETFDGVLAGKYTAGLGQERMGFCTDREDIVSLCLTVTDRLIRRTKVPYSSIGRVDVGTETLIDKSKSVKSCLMQLFHGSGNTDVEGVDNLNACYGGTAALFNCIDWVESSAWDGRYALVVAGDIAVYAEGKARCTGGAGAVAMLIGPQAAVVFDQGVRTTFMEHAYDFYKPNMASEYPTVDGDLSIKCYTQALDNCYRKYREKFERRILDAHAGDERVDLDCLDYVVFHSPFTRLVQKSLSRMFYQDFLGRPQPDIAALEEFRTMNLLDSDCAEKQKEVVKKRKELETLLLNLSQDIFDKKTNASLMVARNVGNMYTASLYGGLASLLASCHVDQLENKRVGFFSYGSGVASSFFSARFVRSERLSQLVASFQNLRQRLDQRIKIIPDEFHKTLKKKEEAHHLAPYSPSAPLHVLEDDVFYLTNIDKMHRRQYSVKRKSNL